VDRMDHSTRRARCDAMDVDISMTAIWRETLGSRHIEKGDWSAFELEHLILRWR
jgi:hypothetical protein